MVRRHLDRKTPWRLVMNYCRAAGIDPDRLDGRGIHSLRKTAINDAIRNGAEQGPPNADGEFGSLVLRVVVW